MRRDETNPEDFATAWGAMTKTVKTKEAMGW